MAKLTKIEISCCRVTCTDLHNDELPIYAVVVDTDNTKIGQLITKRDFEEIDKRMKKAKLEYKIYQITGKLIAEKQQKGK